jgi:hypothetical protein
MTALATVLALLARVPVEEKRGAAERIVAATARYSISAFGPLAVSGAHFLAAIILLHALPRAAFGLFSFMLVAVPFCLSLCGSLLALPVARAAAREGAVAESEMATYLKANLVLSFGVALGVAALMYLSQASFGLAALFGVYGGTMTLRWFARCYTYAMRHPFRAMASDLAYSTLLVAGLVALQLLHQLTMWSATLLLLGAAISGFAAFDKTYLLRQWQSVRTGRLRPYLEVWQKLTRWSMLGVVLTEMTVNAHAYLVTFISGPEAFAVLALGSLFMRPVSLVLAALPDMERPLMTRKLVAGDRAGAFQTVKEFRTATGAVWLATLVLAGVLVVWFPHLLLKKDYPQADVIAVIAISALIMALRTFRTPESVLLQAAGEFRALAGASAWSSGVALAATFALLMLVGPIGALFGIVAGDAVMTGKIFALTRHWKRQHG